VSTRKNKLCPPGVHSNTPLTDKKSAPKQKPTLEVLDRTSQQQFRRWWSSLPSQWRQTNACRAFFGKHKIPAKGSAVSYLLLDDFKTWFKALYHPHTLSPEEREFFKQEYFLVWVYL